MHLLHMNRARRRVKISARYCIGNFYYLHNLTETYIVCLFIRSFHCGETAGVPDNAITPFFEGDNAVTLLNVMSANNVITSGKTAHNTITFLKKRYGSQ